MTIQLLNALKELKGYKGLPSQTEVLAAPDGNVFSGDNWKLEKVTNSSFYVTCGK